MSFKPFTLSHPEKDLFARFEPTDDAEVVFVRFKGACGHIMENLIDAKVMDKQVAHLYSVGYVEMEEPEEFAPRYLHELGD